MNYLLLIIFSIGLNTANVTTQKQDSIKIVFDENVDVYNLIGKALISKGFVIKSSSKDFGQIATEFKDWNDANISIIASIEGNTCILRGEFIWVAFPEDPPSKIENRGMSGSAFKKAWKALYQFAEITDGEIIKQP